MQITRLLEAEARRRGLWPPEASPDADFGMAEAFAMVREMPYARASDLRPETIVREWRGTCSGKHCLLKAIFAEHGYRSRLVACPHYIPPEVGKALPPDLAALFDDGPVPDVHNYLILETDQGLMKVDATWPLVTRAFGLPANERFVPGEDQAIACRPLAEIPVPEDVDPQAFKEQLLKERFTPGELRRRHRLIEGVGRLMTAS